jgi:transcriptional regulator with XRE-family HTH domain
MTQSEFLTQLRNRMAELGITRNHLASLSGLPSSRVAHWLNPDVPVEHVAISLDVACKLAAALGLELSLTQMPDYNPPKPQRVGRPKRAK